MNRRLTPAPTRASTRVSTRAASQLPPASSVSDAQIEWYMNYCMGALNMTREEVTKGAIEMCGSVETAARGVGAAIEQGKATIAQQYPDGLENAEFQLGRKPKLGEEVKSYRLGPNLSIRFWDGELAHLQSYALDFVDGKGRYISTPKGIKIFTMPTPFKKAERVHSIEQYLEGEDREKSAEMERLAKYSPFIDHSKFKYDKNWETYIIPEGINLRIQRDGHSDRFLAIPMRADPSLAWLH